MGTEAVIKFRFKDTCVEGHLVSFLYHCEVFIGDTLVGSLYDSHGVVFNLETFCWEVGSESPLSRSMFYFHLKEMAKNIPKGILEDAYHNSK